MSEQMLLFRVKSEVITSAIIVRRDLIAGRNVGIMIRINEINSLKQLKLRIKKSSAMTKFGLLGQSVRSYKAKNKIIQ